MPSIGIVYGAQSGTIRQVIMPDSDKQLQRLVLRSGEAMLTVDPTKFRKGVSASDLLAAIETYRGKISESPRCAVVDANGDVLDVVLADPLIDADLRGELIRHPNADVGWKKLGSEFIDLRPASEPANAGTSSPDEVR